MRQDGDGHVTPAAGRRVHVDGGVGALHEREERVREPLSDRAGRIARERRPGIHGRLVERRLQVESHRHAMIDLEGERVLDRNTDETAGQCSGIHGGQHAGRDSDTVGLVAVDGGSQVEGWTRPRAVYQRHRQPDERSVRKLRQLDRRPRARPGRHDDARNRPVADHHRAPGAKRSRTAPAWTAATSRRSAVSMYSSGPPMLWTAGPYTTVGMPARRKKRPSVYPSRTTGRIVLRFSALALASTSFTSAASGDVT